MENVKVTIENCDSESLKYIAHGVEIRSFLFQLQANFVRDVRREGIKDAEGVIERLVELMGRYDLPKYDEVIY